MSSQFLEDGAALVTTVEDDTQLYGVSGLPGSPVDERFTKANLLKEYLKLAGGTMTGAIAMGTNKITGLGDPTADQDAATKKYVDDNSGSGIANVVEDTTPELGGDLDALGNDIDNIGGAAGASAGALRLANNVSAAWLNAGGTADYRLCLNASDQFIFDCTDGEARVDVVAYRNDSTPVNTDIVGGFLGRGNTTGAGATSRSFGEFIVEQEEVDDGTRDGAFRLGIPVGGSFISNALRVSGASDAVIIGLSNLDLNGKNLILDADGDTLLEEISDDIMRFTFPTDSATAGFRFGNEDGYIELKENSAVAGTFTPDLLFNIATGTNASKTRLITQITPANDTGTEPIFIFESEQNDSTDVENRPLFAVRNNSTVVQQVLASGDLDLVGNNIDSLGVAFLDEQAAADADQAGKGQLWVKTATPNEMFFTDDAGTDYRLDGFSVIQFIIDGGGSALTTGVKGYLEVPFDCEILSATLLADQSGSVVVDIWKDTYANYPPTDADSITASAVPTITTDTDSQDTTLTGWTTTVAEGDILGFNVDSATTIERVTISLKVRKT